MREYRYQATEDTVEALRLLKSPWKTATLHARALVVLTEEARIRLSVEREEVEAVLDVQRLRADVITGAGEGGSPDAGDQVLVADLGTARNDVVLFTGETWAEYPGGAAGASGVGNGAVPAQVFQVSGRPGQRPPSAALVCTTTDAIVVAAPTGEGILIRIGARPLSLEVVQERAAIARFLVQRGYTTE